MPTIEAELYLDVKPEKFFEYKGHTLYRVYDRDHYRKPLSYSYSFFDDERYQTEFDIRDLLCFSHDKEAKQVIMEAIDSGELPKEVKKELLLEYKGVTVYRTHYLYNSWHPYIYTCTTEENSEEVELDMFPYTVNRSHKEAKQILTELIDKNKLPIREQEEKVVKKYMDSEELEKLLDKVRALGFRVER